MKTVEEQQEDAQKVLDAVGDVAESVVEGLSELTQNFLHNPIGTILTLIFDILRTIFGDIPQCAANAIQNLSERSNPFRYVYSRTTLEKNGEDGNLNKYTNVGDYKEDDKKEWQKVINIKKQDDDDKRFDEKTGIPVMKGDIYNIAVGHISFLDINFLTGNQTHKDDVIWLMFRNVAATLTHITLYIACAILLISLILFGLQIARSSFNDPARGAQYKSKLESFTKAIATLIGSLLIMGLSIFGSSELFNGIEKVENTELPIRVNVETAGYSFSTTAAGYIRYMAGIEDVDEFVDKFIFTIAFIVLSIINLVSILLMIVRMLLIWFLSIIGPIIAVLSIFNIELFMSFKTWVSKYILYSAIQVIFSMVYAVILNYVI